MKGVLIVGHGSRRRETEMILESVVEMAKKELEEIPMEIAYMEFGTQDIPTALDTLLSKGVDDIAVVPYFLYDGMHIKKDIPEELEKYRLTHPGIKISMGKPLGADERLAAILADRIRDACE